MSARLYHDGRMTAEPVVRSRPRAFWSDVRFLLGIALVIASIAGVWLVVSANRQTEPVLAASRTILPGQQLAPADLQVIEVSLGRAGDAYATPGTLTPGAVATRVIPAGELVPRAAMADAGATATTSVVVRSTTDVPASVGTGSEVELWSAPALERGVFDEPRILVPTATVVSVRRDDSMIGTSGTALEVVIDRADVAAVLSAISDGAALSAVPVAGSSR